MQGVLEQVGARVSLQREISTYMPSTASESSASRAPAAIVDGTIATAAASHGAASA